MAKETKLIKVFNTQTGQKKTVNENLWRQVLQGERKNGVPVWQIQSEMKSFNEIEFKPEEEGKSSYETLKEKLLNDKTFINALIVQIALNTETPESDNTEYELNPFDIQDPEHLMEWLSENGISFPKTVKKLESLQSYIPEIYKKS